VIARLVASATLISTSYSFLNLFMAILAKKHAACSPACMGMKWVICVLLFLVSLAALVGVYETHFLSLAPMRVQFGSTSGSLAVLAFSVAVTCFGKKIKSCMGSCDVCNC